MQTYQANDPRGWCGDPTRGAALGRPTIAGESTYSGKLTLRRIRLSVGYDCNGTYFGQGAPLYWLADAEGTIDRMLRAPTRAAAKAQALTWYPQARFYR